MKIAQLDLDGRVEILGADGECWGCLEADCEGCCYWHDGEFTSPTLQRLRAPLDPSLRDGKAAGG